MAPADIESEIRALHFRPAVQRKRGGVQNGTVSRKQEVISGDLRIAADENRADRL